MLKDSMSGAGTAIQAYYDNIFSELPDLPVVHAMRYALRGGKGFRGFLVLESSRLYGIDQEVALPAAAAVEALHAYSLVHDDLPCMDDDDLRRGQPTVHVKWDEATAVLAGDALQTLAFELLTKIPQESGALRLVKELAKASGATGMVRGQALDIAAETAEQPLNIDEITDLQAGKTGAIIEFSAVAGPALAGAETKPMREYARAIGLAFQIADDLLDVEGDEATAGKRLQKDANAGKATFVSLLGLEGARSRARELSERACNALAEFGSNADTLREAARFVISRSN